MKILIRGAGDLATGIAAELWERGHQILMTDVAIPLTVRREVAFSRAVYEEHAVVEGIEAVLAENFEEAEKLVNEGKNPIAIKDGDNYKGLVYVFDKFNKKYLVVSQSEYNAEPYIVKGNIYGDSEDYIEGSTGDLYQKSFNKMIEQVEKNKGFYISRFEIGNLNNAVNNNEKVVSKANEEENAMYKSKITKSSWMKRLFNNR